MSTILVIEDNADILENLEELLILSDYEVLTASNGCAGIDLAQKEIPDLILCDITMPKKNGYEVLEALKSQISQHSIPFIFLTANAQEKDIAMGKSSKADYYITKPFKVSELLKVIRLFLNKKIPQVR